MATVAFLGTPVFCAWQRIWGRYRILWRCETGLAGMLQNCAAVFDVIFADNAAAGEAGENEEVIAGTRLSENVCPPEHAERTAVRA